MVSLKASLVMSQNLLQFLNPNEKILKFQVEHILPIKLDMLFSVLVFS